MSDTTFQIVKASEVTFDHRGRRKSELSLAIEKLAVGKAILVPIEAGNKHKQRSRLCSLATKIKKGAFSVRIAGNHYAIIRKEGRP